MATRYDNWLSAPMADAKPEPTCPECGYELECNLSPLGETCKCLNMYCDFFGMEVDING